MHFGGQEIWIVLGIVVVLFGAKKLPELGRSLGQGIKEFKKTSKGILDEEDEQEEEEEKEEKPAAPEGDSAD